MFPWCCVCREYFTQSSFLRTPVPGIKITTFGSLVNYFFVSTLSPSLSLPTCQLRVCSKWHVYLFILFCKRHQSRTDSPNWFIHCLQWKPPLKLLNTLRVTNWSPINSPFTELDGGNVHSISIHKMHCSEARFRLWREIRGRGQLRVWGGISHYGGYLGKSSFLSLC